MRESNGPRRLGEALLEEAERRIVGESIPRLRVCLDRLNEEEIWRRRNDETPSVGNLVLHLCGNGRQWLRAGLLGERDDRNRDAEFDEPGPIPKDELLRRVDALEETVRGALLETDPADLLRKRPVQIFDESGVSILVHVIEHFSYHVGQIAREVKAGGGGDLGFYDGLELGGGEKE